MSAKRNPEHEAIAHQLRDSADEAQVETVLASLRRAGASQLDSARALYYGAGIPLDQVKVLIDASETWRDHREGNARARAAAVEWLDADQA